MAVVGGLIAYGFVVALFITVLPKDFSIPTLGVLIAVLVMGRFARRSGT